MIIERCDAVEEELENLSALLTDCVDAGASIGYLPPLSNDLAVLYWREVAATVNAGTRVLLVAKNGKTLAGSVQLSLCTKQNGLHRAEVEKLMVHTNYRRKGVGRTLLNAIEQIAVSGSRRLIVLDTRADDVASNLYRSAGYIEAGRIPEFALSASGKLDGTSIFYKLLD